MNDSEAVNELIVPATGCIWAQAQARPAVQAGRLDQGRNAPLRPEAPRPAGRAAARAPRDSRLEQGSRGSEEFVHSFSVELVAQWARFDEAAFTAAWRLEQALDARGEPPPHADVHAARRLRFVANHRLRWILFQTGRAQAGLRLL